MVLRKGNKLRLFPFRQNNKSYNERSDIYDLQADQSILKRIKEYSNDVYDYEVSKRFDIDGIIIRSISIVCSEETIEKIKDCGYMTKNVVIKD